MCIYIYIYIYAPANKVTKQQQKKERYHAEVRKRAAVA